MYHDAARLAQDFGIQHILLKTIVDIFMQINSNFAPLFPLHAVSNARPLPNAAF